MKPKTFTNQSGATLVEVLVAIALTAILIPVLAVAMITASDAQPETNQQIMASGLLNQLITATNNVRDNGWSNIASDGTYHPVISSGTWSLATGTATFNQFTESIVISDVNRDSGDNIVTSGGTLDPSTKLITATITWDKPYPSHMTDSFYLSRWQNTSQYTQSTSGDFNGDNLTGLSVNTSPSVSVSLSPGQTSGMLTSSTFDAGSDVGFNFISVSESLPSDTSIKIQIASNDDNSTWNYVGPDGTNATYYTSDQAIPLNNAEGRYFRFQATFSGTPSATPLLYSFNLNCAQ